MTSKNILPPDDPDVNTGAPPGDDTDHNPAIEICYNTRWRGKPSKEEHSYGEYNWKRVTTTPHRVMDAVAKGYAFTAALGNKIKVSTTGKSSGIHRDSSNFVSLQLAGVDFDNGTQFEDVLNYALARNSGSFLYPTASHTREAPRCRIIFCLEAPITDPERAGELQRALIHHFGGSQPDEGVHDCVRVWYGTRPGNEPYWIGEMLAMSTVDALVAEYRAAGGRTRPTQRDSSAATAVLVADPAAVAKAQAWLARLKPERADDYEDWLHTGMALKSGLGNAGLPIWEDWSRQSGRFEAGVCAKKWDTFKLGGEITMGKLMLMANTDSPVMPVNGNHAFDVTEQMMSDEEVRKELADKAAESARWTAYSRDSDGHALAVVERRGAHIRYCAQLGWLAWNGKCWATDDADAAVTQIVREVLRERVSEQAAIPGGDMAQRVRSCVPTAGNVDGVVRLLGRTPALRVSYKALDSDIHLLNVQNGVVNLRTGELLPHDPALLMTHVASAAYDSTATAPTWERFIEQMLPDPAMRVFVQRLLGYALTGDATEQVLFYWWGGGNNGKSTALDAVRTVMGDYAMQASPDLLVEDEGHKPEQAEFLGRRLVTVQEVPEDKRMNVTLMKYATGESVMRARHLYQKGMEFRVTAKMIISANNKLEIRETDDGTWRRILLTPWIVSIQKDRVDKGLPKRLEGEHAGILNWLVAGAMSWYANGLAVPSTVTTASADYREESDAVSAWLDACTVIGKEMRCSSSALYASYKSWCDSNGHKPRASNSWAGKLQGRGLTKDRTRVGMIWSGVGLLDKQNAEDV